MEEKTELQLHCLFCFSTNFVLPDEGYQPKSGELVKCSNCGRMNDYDSLMRIAKKKGKEWAEEQAKKLMKDFKKQMNKIKF